MCRSIQNADVTVDELHKIQESNEQMKRLCQAMSSGQSGNTLHRSVMEAVNMRVQEYQYLMCNVETLTHVCRHIQRVNDEVQGIYRC